VLHININVVVPSTHSSPSLSTPLAHIFTAVLRNNINVVVPSTHSSPSLSTPLAHTLTAVLHNNSTFVGPSTHLTQTLSTPLAQIRAAVLKYYLQLVLHTHLGDLGFQAHNLKRPLLQKVRGLLLQIVDLRMRENGSGSDDIEGIVGIGGAGVLGYQEQSYLMSKV